MSAPQPLSETEIREAILTCLSDLTEAVLSDLRHREVMGGPAHWGSRKAWAEQWTRIMTPEFAAAVRDQTPELEKVIEKVLPETEWPKENA